MRVTVHPPTGEDPSEAEMLRLYDEGGFVPVPEVVVHDDGRVVLDESPAAERRRRRHDVYIRSLRVEVRRADVRHHTAPRARERRSPCARRTSSSSTTSSNDPGDDPPAPEAALAAPFGRWTS